MTEYCYVHKGQIVDGPGPLPKVWRNISGLDLLPDARLEALGWFPVEDSQASVDPATEAQTAPALEVFSDKVVRTIGKRLLTSEEIAARQSTKDADAIREAGRDLALITVELIERLILDGVITTQNFSPDVRRSFQDIKAIADRVRG